MDAASQTGRPAKALLSGVVWTDTDGDGVNDGREYRGVDDNPGTPPGNADQTDPLDPDSDDDGTNDGDEDHDADGKTNAEEQGN